MLMHFICHKIYINVSQLVFSPIQWEILIYWLQVNFMNCHNVRTLFRFFEKNEKELAEFLVKPPSIHSNVSSKIRGTRPRREYARWIKI